MFVNPTNHLRAACWPRPNRNVLSVWWLATHRHHYPNTMATRIKIFGWWTNFPKTFPFPLLQTVIENHRQCCCCSHHWADRRGCKWWKNWPATTILAGFSTSRMASPKMRVSLIASLRFRFYFLGVPQFIFPVRLMSTSQWLSSSFQLPNVFASQTTYRIFWCDALDGA